MGYKISYEASRFSTFCNSKELKRYVNDILRTDVNQKNTCPLTRNNIYLIRKEYKSGIHLEYFCSVSSLAAREELRKIVYDCLQEKELNMLCYDSATVEPIIPMDEYIEEFTDIAEVLLPRMWEEDPLVVGTSYDFLASTIMMVLHVDSTKDDKSDRYIIHRLYERQYNI